ncbi:MAG: hypothetical protein K2K22_08475 [Muribaculaceae bacterium]|nr:hypothetical protein [Muribaculaceae bacterium]MDE6612578.1 hypothetical protein [Muribaculaceae bacterium]
MKKLVLIGALAAILAVGSVSCSKKDSAADASALTSKIENCTNPDSLSLYVDQAKAYAQKLVKEGKIDQAKEYLAKIEPVVKEKAPALAGTLATVETALDKVGDVVGDKTEDAKDAVSAAADSVGSAASQAGEAVADKAGELKDQAADKAGELKDKAADKLQQAANATSEAAQKGADKVKDLLK